MRTGKLHNKRVRELTMIENKPKQKLMLNGNLYYFLINGEVLSVRKDFIDGDVFDTITLTTEQLNSFEWLEADPAVTITVNGIALEDGRCDFALAEIGQDEKIRVVYTTLGGETTEGGVITRETRKDVLSRTDVQNLHKQPLKIAVYEQMPVSRNSDLTVKIIKDKTTPGYVAEPNNKVGLIRWESVYQPQEKQEILYGYSIAWPKDRILIGM